MCGTDSFFPLPAVILPEKIFLKVPMYVISLSSLKTVLEHSLRHSPAVGSILLLLRTRCRASFGPCLRTGVTQGAFWMEMDQVVDSYAGS